MKTNCCINLPNWSECKRLIENEKWCKENGYTQVEEEKPTELHRFIYEEEPAGEEDTKNFRERLSRLINFIVIGQV